MSDDPLQAALALHQAGRLQEAEAIYRQILAADPEQPDALQLLGYLAHQTGNHAAAVELIGRAIALRPDEAIFHNNLGLALGALGRWDEADAHLRRAIALDGSLAEAHLNLGLACAARGRHEEASRHLQGAIDRDPSRAQAHLTLANSLIQLNRLDAAAAVLDRAIELEPGSVAARVNRGSLEIARGEVESGVAHLREALKLDPSDAKARDDLLLALHYRRIDPLELFEEHLKWGTRSGGGSGADFGELSRAALRSDPAWGERLRDAARRLRIGYVSPDFRRHSVAYFIEPILAGHDRAEFDVFCYSNVTQEDEVTARFKSLPLTWRDIATLDDARAAELIRDDAIDLLIDLAGHTGQNRLGIFELRAAPVQLTYLGYPNTSGLGSMNYRITDAIADPPGEADALHTERLLRLPVCGWCYRPPAEAPSPMRKLSVPAGRDDEPARAPASAGAVMFGCFNALAKIAPETIAAWARVLEAVRRSRLVLKSKALDQASVRRSTLERFAAAGVSSDRLELLGRTPGLREHLELYRRIDVALDTFPYNGTTTTCEALWMGVPVATLKGTTHASRVGASLLSAVGLSDCVAETVNDYVNTVARLATEPPRDREGVRRMMAGSILRDEAKFVANFESALRDAWRSWCTSAAGAGGTAT